MFVLLSFSNSLQTQFDGISVAILYLASFRDHTESLEVRFTFFVLTTGKNQTRRGFMLQWRISVYLLQTMPKLKVSIERQDCNLFHFK